MIEREPARRAERNAPGNAVSSAAENPASSAKIGAMHSAPGSPASGAAGSPASSAPGSATYNAADEISQEAGEITQEAGEIIRVSAAFVIDDAGRLLVVRKRGTRVFMQPGGKPEPGETGAETLSRELHEEVGVLIKPDALEPLGIFTAAAANEAGAIVIAEVFRATITTQVKAQAEIEELRWMLPAELATAPVSPLITHHMLALMPRAAER